MLSPEGIKRDKGEAMITPNHQNEILPKFPSIQSPTTYICQTENNNRLRVGWKTLPNLKNSILNFKLKVQIQT